MSYSRYFMIAMPTAAGISGNTTSNAGSGSLLNWVTASMTTAATAAAYVNHLSWSLSSSPTRRKRTIMAAAPAGSTSVPTASAALKIVPSGATAITGSRSLGKFEEKLTSDSAGHAIWMSPLMTAIPTTGRHRGEGSRPPGNSSGVRKDNGAVIPRVTVKIQPTQAAAGSSAVAARAA